MSSGFAAAAPRHLWCRMPRRGVCRRFRETNAAAGAPCGGIWTLAPCHFEDVGFPCLQGGGNERAACGGVWAYAPCVILSGAAATRRRSREIFGTSPREPFTVCLATLSVSTPRAAGQRPVRLRGGAMLGRSTERPPVPFYCFFPFFLPRGPFPRRGKLSRRRSLYRPYSSRTASPRGAPAKGNRNLRRICRSLRRSFSSAFSSS